MTLCFFYTLYIINVFLPADTELLTLHFSWLLFEFCCTLFGGSLLISVKFFTVSMRNSCFFAVGNKKDNGVCMNEVYENRALVT